MNQLTFIKSRIRKAHGGDLSIGKRRSRRPLNIKKPMHVTLRSEYAYSGRCPDACAELGLEFDFVWVDVVAVVAFFDLFVGFRFGFFFILRCCRLFESFILLLWFSFFRR